MRWSSTAYRYTALLVVGCAVLASFALFPNTSSAAPQKGTHGNSSADWGNDVLMRAQQWVDAAVPYGETRYKDGYTEDCVGLVSMAWQVAAPGMGDTENVFNNYVTQISPNDLQPGDALLNEYSHIVLFAGWVNQNDHSQGYNGYEESDGYSGFKGARLTRGISYPYWPGWGTYVPVRYIHRPGPTQPSYYANTIVQWDGDTKPQKTAWYVSSDLKRYWIPDSKTFYCLTGKGIAFRGPISATLLDQLPDQTGQWATCNGAPAATAPVSAFATYTPTSPPVIPPTVMPTPTVTPTLQPQPVNAYDNYGSANVVGRAMCRGNPSNSLSMPGGTASQTFTVPGGVASLSSALVQIDPDSTVTAHLSVLVNGGLATTTSALAAGDTRFSFGPVNVNPGDVVTISITFSATYGKIITVYTVGSPGGTFTASNSCPDGAPSLSTTSTGLRAIVSGLS